MDEVDKQLQFEENRALLNSIHKEISELVSVFSNKIAVNVKMPEEQTIKGTVHVENQPDSISISNIELIREWLNELGNKLLELKAEKPEVIKSLIVSNIAEAKTEKVAISNLSELKSFFVDLEKSFAQNQPIVNVQKQIVEFPTSANKPISVRLSDGKSFYNSIATAFGGGSLSSYKDESGRSAQVELVNGAIPITSPTYITVIRVNAGDPDISYIGKAVPGTATSSAAWQIARLDENTNLDLLYADSGAFTQVYDDREALSYA